MSRKELLSASRTVKEVISSDEYLSQPKGTAFRRAVSRAAFQMVEVDKSVDDERHFTTRELEVLMLARLPGAFESQLELDKHRDSMHPSEVGAHLDKIIDFNHIVRQMIDSRAAETMHEMMKFIGELANTVYDNQNELKQVLAWSRGVVDGMRHEIAVESMSWTLPGVVDVRSSTRAEDKRGVDIVVEYGDNSMDYFDAKSQPARALEANLGADRPRAIWSGLSWGDFGGKLKLTPAELQPFIPIFHQQVNQLHDFQSMEVVN